MQSAVSVAGCRVATCSLPAVEAPGREPDQVGRAPEVLVEQGHRRRARGQVEGADAAHVDPVAQGVEVVAHHRVLHLPVGDEGHEPQLVGIAHDHGATGPEERDGGRGLVDLGRLVQHHEIEHPGPGREELSAT